MTDKTIFIFDAQEGDKLADDGLLIEQVARAQGITEQLKAEDQITWVGAMNNIRSAAEEVVLRDVINC